MIELKQLIAERYHTTTSGELEVNDLTYQHSEIHGTTNLLDETRLYLIQTGQERFYEIYCITCRLTLLRFPAD